MRLFSALPVPDDVSDRLALFRGGLRDAKWVEPADYHVTLAFFGAVERPVAEELAQALSEIVAKPFDVSATRLGIFGADKPHAIVALIEKSPELVALEAAHRAAMARLGIGDPVRKYTPHVTLARLRRTPANDVAEWMGQQAAFAMLSWRPHGFALYSSRVSRGGGPYVAEVEFAFGPDACR